MTLDAQEGAPVVQSSTATPEISTTTPESTAATPIAEPAKPQEDVDFTRRFQALSRKEKQVLERERQYKQTVEDPSFKEFQQWKELKADPRRNATKLVELTGASLSDFYSDLTGLVLNDGKPTVEQELKSLRDQIDADKKAKADREVAEAASRDQALIQQYQQNIIQVAEKNPDEFELMHAYSEDGSYQLALQVAIDYFQRTKGQILDPKKACEAVENYYLEKTKKLHTLKKLGFKEPTTETEGAPEKTVGTKVQPAPSKTLTNSAASFAAAVPSISPSSPNLMDPEVRARWTAEKIRKAREQK